MTISLADSTFYGILDASYVPALQWIDKYNALVEGGASIIQIRAKDVSSAERYALTKSIVEHRLARADSKIDPPLVINDDIELALAFPDLGLHVGQDDLPARVARERLGPERILGLSTHSPSQANQAIELGPEILSYFAVGPIFPTQTKPDYVPVGLELARYVAEQAPALPFFCIGGINRGNIDQVRETGAKRIVIVSDVLCDLDTASAVRRCLELIES